MSDWQVPYSEIINRSECQRRAYLRYAGSPLTSIFTRNFWKLSVSGILKLLCLIPVRTLNIRQNIIAGINIINIFQDDISFNLITCICWPSLCLNQRMTDA